LLLLSCVSLALSLWILAFKAVGSMDIMELMLVEYVLIASLAKPEER